MAADEVLGITLRFKTIGLDGLVGELKRVFAEIARSGATAPEQVRAAGAAKRAAESRVVELTGPKALAGQDQSSQADLRKRASQVFRSMDLMADQFRLIEEANRNHIARLKQKFGTSSGLVAQELDEELGRRLGRAEFQGIRAGDSEGAQELRAANAAIIRDKRRESAQIQELLAAEGELALAVSREATARRKIAAQVARADRTPDALEAEAQKRIEQRRTSAAQRLRTAAVTTPDDLRREAAADVVERGRRAQQGLAESKILDSPTGKLLLAQEGEVVAARQRQKASIDRATQEALANDDGYILATAAAKRAREIQAARITLAAAGESDRDAAGNPFDSEELAARAAVAQKTQADLRAARVANLQAETGSTAIAASVQRRNSESRLRAAEARLERAYIREEVARGGLGGTTFQRLQSRFSPQARAPQEFQTLNQFVGQKVVQTAGYGLGAALFYGALSGASTLLDEAEKLQRVFVEIESQLESIGQGGSLVAVKQQVLDIAKTTGQASADVGKVAFQFIGAFKGDVPRALDETASAMKLVEVTGLELSEVVDSLTAISITYGITIREIGDTTLGLQERFGVLSKEIVTFVGDTAAVAEEAQISFKDLAAIGAIAQQQSGKSGAVLAEQFNRIIPAISDSKVEILSLYSLLGEGGTEASQRFAAGYDTILAAFSQGKTGDVFKQLAADFNSLSVPDQQAVYSQLGGKREAQTLIAILRDSQRLQNEFDANQTEPDRDAGQLQKKFEDIQQTLANTQARLAETFKQIGEALLQSGISDILVDLANGLSVILQLGTGLVGVFSSINSLLGGLPGGLAKGVAVALLLNKAFVTLSGAKTLASIAGLGQAASSSAVAAAADAETAAVGRATVADQANSASSVANAEANTIQSAALQRTALMNANLAQAQGFGAPLPAPPSRATQFLGSGIGTRLFSGGRFLQSGVADASAARAGISSGASGLGIAAIATAGALAVKSAYDENANVVAQQASGLREKLREKNVDEIRKIAETHTEGWALIGTKIFFEDLPEDIARQELGLKESEGGRRYIQALGDTGKLGDFTKRISDDNLARLQEFANFSGERTFAAINAGLTSEASGFLGKDVGVAPIDRDKLAEALPKLKEAAANKEQGAIELVTQIETILKDQGDLGDLRAILDELVSQGKTKEAIEAAGSVDNLLKTRTAPVKARRDAGLANDFQVEQVLRRELDAIKEVIDSGAETDPDKLEELLVAQANGEKELREGVFARLRSRSDALRQLRELTGGSANAQFDESIQVISNPNLSAGNRLELLPGLIDDFQAKLEEDLENIKDPVERAQAALDGADLPPELQSLLAEQQLLDTEKFQEISAQLADITKEPLDGYGKEVADVMIEMNVTANAAVQIVIKRRIDKLRKILADPTDGLTGSDLDPIREQIDKLEELATSSANSAELDNVSVSAKAFADLSNKLNEDYAQAADDRAKGFLDLAAAFAEGNPVAEANVALQQAQLALSTAVREGDAGKIASAQGDVVRAQKQAARAARDIVAAQADFLKVAADGDPIREAQAEIQGAYVQLAQAVADGDAAGQISAQGDILAGQQRLRDDTNDIIRSQIELAQALAGPDGAGPYDVALADFDAQTARGAAAQNRAAIAQIEARRQAKQNEAERQDSQFDIIAAQVERNPLAAAQLALRRADAAAARAETEVERNQAMAQRIQAEHAIEDAIAAISQSQIDVLIAMADYAGDTVESASLALRKAQENLSRLQAQGAGEEQINASKAEVIRAQAAQRDAKLADRLGDIEFLQQIGNITTAQAIEMLEAVAQMPDLTEEQVRQIRLKIKQLQQELSGDFQFNLPNFLGVPTAYEARRVDQTIGSGATYDNRQISIPIQINGVQDPAAVGQAVVAAIEEVVAPGRFSTGNRRY